MGRACTAVAASTAKAHAVAEASSAVAEVLDVGLECAMG